MKYRIELNETKTKNRLLYGTTNLTLPENGITLIKGDNGSGKSTLLKHIMYAYPYTALLISQENFLIFDDLSVMDNIMLCKKEDALLSELLGRFRLEYILDRKPRYLSGGEKRIVSILRLFFTDKKVILIDEPTNDLDQSATKLILDLLNDLSKQKTLVIVSHDLRFDEIAGTVFELCDGTIRCIKQDAEIMDEPTETLDIIKNPSSRYCLKKIFRKEHLSAIVYLLLVVLFLASAIFFCVADKNSIVDIKDDQTNIATMGYAPIEQMLGNGYLPLEAYTKYNGRIDLDYIVEYSKILDDTRLTTGTGPIFLEKNLGEQVYSAIYKDGKTEKKLFDIYSQIVSEAKDQGVDIEKTLSLYDGIKTLTGWSVPGGEAIDYSIYSAIEAALFAESPSVMPMLYCVINADEEAIKSLEYRVFIKNNTTVSISRNINQITTLRNTAVFLLCGVVVLTVMYYVVFGIALKNNEKKVIVLRNMSVPREQCVAELLKKMLSPIRRSLYTITASAGCYSLSFAYPGKQTALLLITVTCAVIGTSVVIISYFWLDRLVSRIYSFDGLYK